MSASSEAMAQREVEELRERHPGISVRVHCESLGDGPSARHCVALDVRGPEFQEIVPGRPFPTLQKALAAAVAEAEQRLRARAARLARPVRVVLACPVPDPVELT